MPVRGPIRQRGLSLLEVLIAFTIMSMSLAALYHAAGGSVRGAVEAERQSRAVVLAQSLLALNPSVLPRGVANEGRFEDLRWQVSSAPLIISNSNDSPPAIGLQRIVVRVEWSDRGRDRSLSLVSVVPERAQP